VGLKNLRRKGATKSGSAQKPCDGPNVPAASPNPKNLPAIASDGQIMQTAGKYARNAVMTTFHQMGGVEKLTEEAKKDPKWFYEKLFSKTITRETEEVKTEDLEDILDIIDAEAEEVTEAQDVEFEDVGGN